MLSTKRTQNSSKDKKVVEIEKNTKFAALFKRITRIWHV